MFSILCRKLCKHRRKAIISSILSATSLLFLYKDTVKVNVRDFFYITRPLWDTPPNIPDILIPHFYADGIAPGNLCHLHGWDPRPDNQVPTVIDAFIFSVELDLLEIRLKELWDVVDIFILVEADKTFTGKPKPLFYNNSQHNFFWAKEKLRHFVSTGLSHSPKKDFENEAQMRGFVTKCVKSVNPQNGDLIIVGDIDEIPYAHTIQLLKSCGEIPSELHLDMTNYLYSFEFRLPTSHWRPHVSTFTSTGFGYYHGKLNTTHHRLADGGWHCSFCFRHISQFVFKMTSYSHSDRVTNTKLLSSEEIQKKICSGQDIYDMFPEAYTFQDLIAQSGKFPKSASAVGVPKYVVENPIKFKFLLPEGCQRENETDNFMQTK